MSHDSYSVDLPRGDALLIGGGGLSCSTRRPETRAKVVGAEGYAHASVAKVTALAEIAQGTFYNYFASQQDLFDQLLPELGTELLDFIRTRIAGESDSFTK